jgi:hypothetical protein
VRDLLSEVVALGGPPAAVASVTLAHLVEIKAVAMLRGGDGHTLVEGDVLVPDGTHDAEGATRADS